MLPLNRYVYVEKTLYICMYGWMEVCMYECMYVEHPLRKTSFTAIQLWQVRFCVQVGVGAFVAN